MTVNMPVFWKSRDSCIKAYGAAQLTSVRSDAHERNRYMLPISVSGNFNQYVTCITFKNVCAISGNEFMTFVLGLIVKLEKTFLALVQHHICGTEGEIRLY